MKKLTGVILAVMMMSVVLTGCYSKTCDQQTYKGQMQG